MTERAFKLRAFFFGYVLPLIDLDWLLRCFGFSRRAQEYEPDHCEHNNDGHRVSESSSLGFECSTRLTTSPAIVVAAVRDYTDDYPNRKSLQPDYSASAR